MGVRISWLMEARKSLLARFGVLGLLPGLLQTALGLALGRHVAHDQQHAAIVRVVLEVCAGALQVSPVSVAAAPAALKGDVFAGRCQKPAQQVVDAQGVLGVDEINEDVLGQLIELVACDARGGRALQGQVHAQVVVQGQEHKGAVLHDGLEPGLALAQGVQSHFAFCGVLEKAVDRGDLSVRPIE